MVTVSSLTNQGCGKVNEDCFFLSERRFGVFDGMTGLVPYRDSTGNTGGKIAAATACEIFNSQKDFLRCAEESNRIIQERMLSAQTPIEKTQARWGTTVAVIEIQDTALEYCLLGDSFIIMSSNEDNKLLGKYNNHDKYLLRKIQRKRAQTENPLTQFHRQIVALRKEANRNYGVLNGDPRALSFFQRGRIDLRGLHSVLICSDGFCFPSTYPSDELPIAEIVSTYRSSGLEGTINNIRTQERTDPALSIYPRYKIHDDATAIAIEF